jgi:hypothetical protein
MYRTPEGGTPKNILERKKGSGGDQTEGIGTSAYLSGETALSGQFGLLLSLRAQIDT